MSSEIASQNEDVTLHCPSCTEEKFRIVPMTGKNGERFVKVHCHNCGEHLFFQTLEIEKILSQPGITPENWETEQIRSLQLEWEEWLKWKQRHLNKPDSSKSLLIKYAQWLLAFLLIGCAMFFVLDRWHLLDPLVENHESRQQQIMEYAEALLEVPCFPSILKVKIRTVPIRYTRERPVHQNWIQYGEAGVYWGEEQIKIHRSNFWFFGWPKKSQLVNTLVHELRHRSNPELGHNPKFMELVEKDTLCALKYLN